MMKLIDVRRCQSFVRACVALLPLATATGVTASPHPTKPHQAPEVFSGGGRACTGKLIISAKTIQWQTPFSQCASQPYTLVLEKDEGSNHSRVFALKKPSGKCLYQFILVEMPLAGGQTQVSRFQTRQDYEQKNYANALSCPMIATQ
jgi:hypothetical protein